jgi:hypothetical protein
MAAKRRMKIPSRCWILVAFMRTLASANAFSAARNGEALYRASCLTATARRVRLRAVG